MDDFPGPKYTWNMSSKTVVLFGGSSDERRVSVASAQNIAQELDDAALWFWSPKGKIHLCTLSEVLDFTHPFESNFQPPKTVLYENIFALADDWKNNDRVFFLALHGGEGEDGTLQEIFESRNLAFTGSGADSSHKAFDKRLAKRIVHQTGIRVAPEAIVSGKDATEAKNAIQDMLYEHKDVILKPVTGGSSIGLLRVRNKTDIDVAVIELERQGGTPYLMEPYIKGTEITVGVFDDGTRLKALPPSEVQVDMNRSFDYEGKYLGRGAKEITPADIPESATKACQQLALTAHRALNCEGYSRTDIIMGQGGPIFLELNTLPGLTKASFIPQQLKAANIPFRRFLQSQVILAMRRSRTERTA